MFDAYRGTATTSLTRRHRAAFLRHVAATLWRHLASRAPHHPTVPPTAAHG